MGLILENQEISKKPKHHLSRLFKGSGRSFRWIAGGLALALGLALIWFGITKSSRFALTKIEVVGELKQVSMQQIMDAAGVLPGSNIFSLSLKNVERNVLNLPWVANVSVRRQAPSILWIHVKEQEPLALLLTDKLYYVSSDGVVFKEAEQESCRDLPVLTGFNKQDSLHDAVQLIHFLENSSDFELFGVSEIHYNEAIGFSVVTLLGPMEVKLGKEEFEMKLARLKNIWPEISKKFGRVHGIDLDYSDKAFVKL